MSSGKQVICSDRVRQVPAQFSWVDQRLVRDRYLGQLDVHAAALYLFLITVADSRGLSWYGDLSMSGWLSMDKVRLRQARDDLVRTGLIAHKGALYQVLALEDPVPRPVVLHRSRPDSEALQPVAKHGADSTTVRRHLDMLHATLRRQP